MKDFFISYNQADQVIAKWIVYQLDKANYTTISRAWDFLAGGNFALEMHEASMEAEHTLPILSPDYLNPKAAFSQAEWAAAFTEDPMGKKGKLLPIRVRECTPRGLLAAIIYIDLVDLDREEAQEKLLAEVRRERRRPLEEPPFPDLHS